MDSKDFFGAPDPENMLATPSVLSLVTKQCAEDLSHNYRALENGMFSLVHKGRVEYILSESDVASDIRSWVRGLQGGGALGDKIVSIVRSNTGWESIITRRVIRELRKRATGA